MKAIGVSLNLVKARVSEGNRGLTKPTDRGLVKAIGVSLNLVKARVTDRVIDRRSSAMVGNLFK